MKSGFKKIVWACISFYLMVSFSKASYREEPENGQRGVISRRASVALTALKLPVEERYVFAVNCIERRMEGFPLSPEDLDKVAVFLLNSIKTFDAKCTLAWLYLEERAGRFLSHDDRIAKVIAIFDPF